MKNLLQKLLFSLFVFFLFTSCNSKKKETVLSFENQTSAIEYANGFSIKKLDSSATAVIVNSPWPEANRSYSYLLVKKNTELPSGISIDQYDAVIRTPVTRVIATSTTHIAALEALGVETSIVGFPNTTYISSKRTRERIEQGQIAELGKNEDINTEITLNLAPDIIFGFSINNQNSAYQTLKSSNIPVVFNGDWTEQTPLGKAEWIRFFAPFYELEEKADSIFQTISRNYTFAKKIAEKSAGKPTILSGALYKDVWYLPGGQSWAAKFIEDANAAYLWKDDQTSGSIALSVESVLEKGQNADYWISPSQFTSYDQLQSASPHYSRFKAFKDQKVFTFARTKGATGGLLYYELGPLRPDLVLKDLIHIFHPELLTGYDPYFFRPLE